MNKSMPNNLKATNNKSIEDYLKQPYARILVPETERGYSAELLEFPGCYAYGETADQAIKNLDNAAFNWIEATMTQGQSVPEPFAENEPSGKYLLRLPRNLHKKAVQMAQKERVSLNTFLIDAVAERVGARDAHAKILSELKEYADNQRRSEYVSLTLQYQPHSLPIGDKIQLQSITASNIRELAS